MDAFKVPSYTVWIPTEQLCTTTGYQKETPWISRKLQKVKLFKESYEYKSRSLGFSWSNVYNDASPEGDAIMSIYICITEGWFLKNVSLVFSQYAASLPRNVTQTKSLLSNSIVSLFMQKNNVFPHYKVFVLCVLSPSCAATNPARIFFEISFISFYFVTLLVKRHPLNSRKTHHGCENSFTFCSNEGDHIASVTFWMTPHKRTRVCVCLCVSLPSRHSTNPQVLRKLWRTSWSRWTLLDVCQVQTLVLQQRNCRACE